MFEMEQIDELINESRPFVNLCRIKKPVFGEKSGAALTLHSFYNGIENIMLHIIKNKDGDSPRGMRWHKELLDKAFEGTENRTRIFREELRDKLDDNLRFRHLVRHLYGFNLEWSHMKDKLFNMETVWKDVKEDFNIFIANN
jgi:hypothetical protein